FTFVVEMSDGARWRTKIPFVSKDWAHYVLSPHDFQYFSGGTRGKCPDLSDIVRFQVAFEDRFSKISQGSHSCYISDVTLSHVEGDGAFGQVSLDDYNLNGVTPLYEQYPITNAVKLSADDMQTFVSARDYVVPCGQNALVSRHAGICGIGYGKNTDIRFIPLITATDAKGLVSGHIAWIDLYATATGANGPCEGSLVGYFGATTDEFYNANGIAAVVETTLAMMRDVFIVNGGTDEHTYIKDETTAITAGLQLVAFDEQALRDVTASVSLYSGEELLAHYSSENIDMIPLINSILAVEGRYDLSGGAPDRVVASLLSDGQTVDRVEHSIHYWSPKPASERSYVYTEDGQFKRDGKAVNFFGTNYYPSYCAAAPKNSEYKKLSHTHSSYTSRDGYDPLAITNDLKRIKSLGMNAIAVASHLDSIKISNNLLDLLRICEELDLYVELSLARVAYPLRGYSASGVETCIKRLHLDECDRIISYDICWEERVGNYLGGGGGAGNGRFIGRAAWDGAFTEWTETQYGSVEAAEDAWGIRLGRTEAGYLLLTDAMIDDRSDKYQKAVAAYNRFLDDAVSTSMAKNVAHLRSLVPHQMVTFRMSMAGSALRTPGFQPSVCCFDFQSLASAMSYMEPEGYQLNADDESCLQVMFANAYARYAKPDAPVVWKEFGRSAWAYREDGNFYPSEAAIEATVDYYRYVLDYCLKSHTCGIYSWWSIAGYRVDEDSDYGVFNPDGSDRGEITALLREYAPKFVDQGARDASKTAYICVDRDDHVGGLFGMFDAVKDDLYAAYQAGKHVTFVDGSHSKSDGAYAYADTLLDRYVADAVSATGIAPLRYVNGIVKDVTTTTEDGKISAKITVCNTKQSVWRANTVSLVSTDGRVIHTFAEDVGYLENVTFETELDVSGDIALRFKIGEVAFGPLFKTTVQ
ncbi:MAG: beta-galactosidase, partial [Clostridia bacterium]|nr:beta-galactosidase [Clostridia bacterium]